MVVVRDATYKLCKRGLGLNGAAALWRELAIARGYACCIVLTDMTATLNSKALVGFELSMWPDGAVAVVVQLRSRKSPAKSFPKLRRALAPWASASQLHSPRGRGGGDSFATAASVALDWATAAPAHPTCLDIHHGARASSQSGTQWVLCLASPQCLC